MIILANHITSEPPFLLIHPLSPPALPWMVLMIPSSLPLDVSCAPVTLQTWKHHVYFYREWKALYSSKYAFKETNRAMLCTCVPGTVRWFQVPSRPLGRDRAWGTALQTRGLWVLRPWSSSATSGCLPGMKVRCQLVCHGSALLSFLLWRDVSLKCKNER